MEITMQEQHIGCIKFFLDKYSFEDEIFFFQNVH